MTIPPALRALLALAATTGLSGRLAAYPPAEYELTFSDEFSRPLDAAVWQIDPTRPNVEVLDGTLQLVTESLPEGGFRTGKLATTTFRQRFGYYEARYRIGGDSGLNNAFWLNTPVPYATSANSYDRFEIDIQETHYPNKLSMTAHDWAPAHLGFGGKKVVVSENLHTTYNTYALEWAHDNTLRYYFNGVLQHTYSGATVRDAANTIPLEVLFSTLVIPFAGPEGPNLNGTRMIVDYVRVYDRPGYLGSINGNWGTEGNWGGGAYARINDAAVFNRPVANTAVTIAGVSKEAREVYFDHPALPSFTFTPRSDSTAAILRLGSGGAGAITLNYTVPSAQIFNLPIVAARRLTLSNFSFKPGALLDIRGPIRADTAGEGLVFFNDGPVVARAPIESSIGPVDKYGNGEATLQAANAHTELTRVVGGTLVVAADGALGTVEAGTETASGATLALAGVTYTALEPLSLAGAGVAGSAGALEARGAVASSFGGPLTLTANARVGARDSGGWLSLTGPIGASVAGPSLTISGAGMTVLSGAISELGNLHVTGSGVVRISNPSSTYGAASSVYVGSGTLLIPIDAPNNAPGPLGASSFRVRVGSTLSQPGDDAALLTEGAVTIGRPLQIEPHNQPGVSKIGGSTPHVSVFAGGVFLGRELTVEAVQGGEVLIQGAMVDFNTAGSVRKTGLGLVRLSGTNTYQGPTVIEAGTLLVDGSTSSQSAVSVTGGWLGGRGTIGGAVSVGAGGGLAFTLASAPASHRPLAISGGLSIASGARVALTLLDGAAPGTYTLAQVASGWSGALPALELPAGWSGEIEVVGGALRVTLAQPAAPAIADWRLQHFGSAESTGTAAYDADPDGDGVPNLLEYALGGEPLLPNSAMLPQPVVIGDRLSMRVPRIADPNLLYLVEASSALTAQSWTSIWSSTGEANAGGTVTVEDTATVHEAPLRFMRLRVVYED
ncbi:MAG: family 16 glycosylhydrolase [Opitutaceae bacterium]|nr:family 16 glycosylhydrolase [Opitutaceae bacterium]